MLVLSHKVGDQIFIGDKITVSLLEIKGRQLVIGIDAPKSIQILRSDTKRTRPREVNGN